MKIKLYATERERDKLEALRIARERTLAEGKKFVVREGPEQYFVCPESGYGYDALGELVAS